MGLGYETEHPFDDEPDAKPMTSPAIRLARELCICAVVDGHIVPAMPSEGLFIRQLETFYAKAQAPSLRDVAKAIRNRP